MTPAHNAIRCGGCTGRRQGGVALAILVWFLAAMSLLVAGIVLQARVDIKLAQLHLTQARIEAAADGAIQLAMAESQRPKSLADAPDQPIPSQVYTLGGYDVTVNFTPVSGLINLNSAPEELLLLLFSSVSDLDESAAHELAVNVVEWRSADALDEDGTETSAVNAISGEEGDSAVPLEAPGNVRHGRFEAIEDLLLVSGMDRHIFDAVEDAVYVSQVGQSGVDWASAPVSVLSVLGGGDTDAAREIAESRTAGDADRLSAPESLDLSFQQVRPLPVYRVDAVVQYDGSVFDRRRWVDRSRPGNDGLPWSFFRSEALKVVSSSAGETSSMEEDVRAGS